MNKQELEELLADNRQRLLEQIRLIQVQHLQFLENQILRRQIFINKFKQYLGETKP